MGEQRWAPMEREDLPQVVALMAACFPKAEKFSAEFLDWQYWGNPVGAPHGCNLFDDGRLVGHLAAIPQAFRLRGEPVRLSLLMNVGIHPDKRGGGLFLELVRRTCQQSADLGHAAVIGVANQQTIRAYETKLDFQNVAGLDAHVEWAPQRLDAGAATAGADLAHDWNDAALAWRLRNPANPLRVAGGSAETLVVEGASTLPLVRARAVIPRAGLAAPARGGLIPAPAVVIGLAPAGTARRGLSVTVPQKLRPSPLRLIYKNFAAPGDRLDPAKVLFSFLDFDAF